MLKGHLFVGNSNPTGPLLTRPLSPGYQEPSLRFQSGWLTKSQVLLQAWVSTSVKWDETENSCGIQAQAGIQTSKPGRALPDTATRGQQHLVLEAPLRVGALTKSPGHSVTQQMLAEPMVTGGLWQQECGRAQREIQGQPHQGTQASEEGAPGSLVPKPGCSS